MVAIYDAAAFAQTLQRLAGGRRMHIITRGTRWALLREGAGRALRVLDTKDGAIREARPYLADGYDVVIHRRDGTVEKWLKAKVPSVKPKPAATPAKPKAKPAARKATLKVGATPK